MEILGFSKKSLNNIALFLLTLGWATPIFANPVLNNVASGKVVIQQSGDQTKVYQSSQKGIVNWRSFNISGSEKTAFIQPKGGVTLNRIDPSQGVSQIYGKLTATGQIILINQAGIHFGPNAMVNVGSIIASTSNITDQHFLAGQYKFDQPSSSAGSIINQGTITASKHGLVALIGTSVSNDGTINAHLGNVVLASGNKFTLDLSGNSLVNFTIDEEAGKAGKDKNGQTLKSGVQNSGRIIADGGSVILTARAAAGVLDHAINMSGVIQANSVHQKNGQIVLAANGDVAVTGKIQAVGKSRGSTGGKVTILGNRIAVTDYAQIDTSGSAGGGTILIGGNAHGQGPEQNAQLTYVGRNVQIKSDALENGDGGKVIVWADGATGFYGSISAQGGSQGGNGGFVETSGKGYLDVNGASVNTLAANGTRGKWLLDPTNIYIAIDQAAATGAGMTGTDNSANTGDLNSPETFAGLTSATDSLLTIANLTNALTTTDVIVTTTNGGSTADGNITVVNPFSWQGTSLTLNADNDITLLAALDWTNGQLNLNANNNVNIQANLNSVDSTNLGVLNVTANNAIHLGGSSPISIGAFEQNYNSAVILDQNTQITNTDGSSANFNSTIDGAKDLVISNNGIQFFGDIGSNTALNSLDLNSSYINLVDVNVTTSGDQIYRSPLGVSGSNTKNFTSTNGNITFDKVTDQSSNFLDINIDAANGNINFNNVFGQSTTYFGLLSANAQNIVFDNSATNFYATEFNLTAAQQNIFNISTELDSNGNILLSGNIVGGPTTELKLYTSLDTATVAIDNYGSSVNPLGSLTIPYGVLNLDGDIYTTGNIDLTYDTEILLLRDAIINSTGETSTGSFSPGDMFLSSVINGAHSLTINTPGQVTLQGSVGDVTPLSDLSITAGNLILGNQAVPNPIMVNTSNASSIGQVYNTPINLIVDTTFYADGQPIAFNQTIDGNHSVNISGSNNVMLSGEIGSTDALTDFIVSSPVTLMGTDRNITTSNNIQFTGTLDGAANLNLTAANLIQLDGDVGTITPLASLTFSGNTTIGAAQITTSGDQNYNNPVLLNTTGSGSTLTSTNGNINLNTVDSTNSVNPLQDLTINAGTVTFNESLGAANGDPSSVLGNLSVNGDTTNFATNATTVYANSISLASSTTNFAASDTTLNSNGDIFIGGNIAGTPTSNLTLTSQSPTANLSVANYGSSTDRLGSLTVNNANLLLNGNIYSTGDINFTGSSVVLGTNVLFDSDASTTTGMIILGDSLNGAHDITINAPGAGGVELRTVGDASPLTSITFTGEVLTANGDITTSGSQTYNGNIVINVPTINFSGTSLTFNNDINGSGNTAMTATIDGTLSIAGFFNAMDSLSVVGSGSTNTFALTSNDDNYWNLDPAGSSVIRNGIQTITFSNIDNLIGGSGNDTFVFYDNAAINSVDGGGGIDALDYSSFTDPLSVNLQTQTASGLGGTFNNISQIYGNNASDSTITGPDGGSSWQMDGSGGVTVTGLANGLSGFINLVGGSGSNTLIGPDTAFDWNITGINSGNTPNTSTNFSNMQNLMGGTDSDYFHFYDGGSVASIDGGAGGINQLDYSNYSSPITINLGTASATGVTSIGNITQALGSSAGSNTLVGANTDNNWVIGDVNSGTVDGLSDGFLNIQNIVGGNANDTFTFSAFGASIESIDGGSGGAKTLDLSGMNAPSNTITLTGLGSNVGFQGLSDAGVPAFTNITNLTGASPTANTLNSNTNLAEAWSFTGAADGVISSTTHALTFNNIQAVAGSSNTDTFNLNSVYVGTIAGGSGNTTFIFPSNTTYGGTFTNSSGTNTFMFGDNAIYSGTITATSSNDKIDFSLYTTPVVMNLTNNTDGYVSNNSSTLLTNFVNFDEGIVSDSTQGSTLVLPSSTTDTLTIDANGVGYYNSPFVFDGFTAFQGSPTDTLVFSGFTPQTTQISPTAFTYTSNGITYTFSGFTTPSPPTPTPSTPSSNGTSSSSPPSQSFAATTAITDNAITATSTTSSPNVGIEASMSPAGMSSFIYQTNVINQMLTTINNYADAQKEISLSVGCIP